MSLADRRCADLPKGTPKLDPDAMKALLPEVPGWSVGEDRLEKTYSFKTFLEAIAFVNRVATLAEAEDHHPDLDIRYSKVKVSTWTHTVHGLSENDFILAAKLDRA